MNEIDEQEPSIEEIKKFADEKRKAIKKVNPELQQKRLENLAKGREIRKQKLLEKVEKVEEVVEEVKEVIPVAAPAPAPATKKVIKKVEAVKEEPDNYTDIDKPFKGDLIGLWQYLAKKDERDKEKEQNFDTLYKEITDIKQIITKPKVKAVKKPKAKSTGKTLDFVVSDKELEAVLNPPDNNTNPVVDKKLQAFLEAFQKK
jgi:hypothetical protein